MKLEAVWILINLLIGDEQEILHILGLKPLVQKILQAKFKPKKLQILKLLNKLLCEQYNALIDPQFVD